MYVTDVSKLSSNVRIYNNSAIWVNWIWHSCCVNPQELSVMIANWYVSFPLSPSSFLQKSGVGASVGLNVGCIVGSLVGSIVGSVVGSYVGSLVGSWVGSDVGDWDGVSDGISVGDGVGQLVGAGVGHLVGHLVGFGVSHSSSSGPNLSQSKQVPLLS